MVIPVSFSIRAFAPIIDSKLDVVTIFLSFSSKRNDGKDVRPANERLSSSDRFLISLIISLTLVPPSALVAKESAGLYRSEHDLLFYVRLPCSPLNLPCLF